MAKSTGKRPPLKGKQFSSDYQPSGEAKSRGWRKSKLLKDILDMAWNGRSGAKLRATAAEYLNIPEDQLTVEDLMNFRQIELAIKKQNTFAYTAVMDRAHGKPVQPVQEQGKKKIVITIKK